MSIFFIRGDYRVRGVGVPNTILMSGTYSVLDSDPTVFVWDTDDLRQPASTRVWTADGVWLPPA